MSATEKVNLGEVIPAPKFSIVNEATGEVVAQTLDNWQSGSKTVEKICVEHSRVYSGALMEALDDELLGSSAKVLLTLIASCKFENYIDIHPKKVADLWKMHPATVYDAYKQLRDRGLLYFSQQPGEIKKLRLDGRICWKGSEKLRKKEEKRREKERFKDLESSVFSDSI